MSESHGEGIPSKITSSYDADATLIPEPLTGAETANIVSELYSAAGPRLGSRLVESNIVLTLAGARGQTEFFLSEPTAEDRKSIEALNDILEKKGIKMKSMSKTFVSPRNGKETLMIDLESLRGYARVSRLTKIPGIKPFDESTGWNGLNTWIHESYESIEQAQSQGIIPCTKDDIEDIFTGVIKGYPDIATYDICKWSNDGRKYQIDETDIAHVSLYKGAEPNFDFLPEHANDPTITDTVKKWGNILGEFYATPWHEKIKTDSGFIAARSQHK